MLKVCSLLIFGYIPVGKEVSIENYRPHTANSLKRLYKEMILFCPKHLRKCVVIEDVTGNAARFTAQRIRLEAGIRKEVRDMQAQHVTKEIRTIYEASENDMVQAGHQMQAFWQSVRSTLRFHDTLLRDFPQLMKRPNSTFSRPKKRVKLDLKRSAVDTPSPRDSKRKKVSFRPD